ncbi:hypothetical protein AX15_005284 [Amanita polypyramis BW_CC]|nr:hypothetical protein AX15_005284 [Amanita polypyramis BW_CC]
MRWTDALPRHPLRYSSPRFALLTCLMLSSTGLHAISPVLFLLVPLFLLLALHPNPLHRPAGPLLARLVLILVAALAVIAAALGLAALPKAEAIIETLFVFILESSVVYIIYSLSSYRLYANALVCLLSSATLFSFLSTLLPVHHTVPAAISPALLVLFSLVSFPLVSHLIFPPQTILNRHNSSQVPLNAPDNLRGFTGSPSLIPFPSVSPSASSATICAPSTTYTVITTTQISEDNFYEVDLEGATTQVTNFTRNKPYPSKVPTLLFIAQVLFLLSSIFKLCSIPSTPDQISMLKISQTVVLVISSFFTISAYSQHVRNFLRDHDRVPEQATEFCDSSNRLSPYAKSVYTNINSMDDATHSLNSQSTYGLPAPQSQYSLSPSASMSPPIKATEVGRVNSSFTLDSRHDTPSTLCVKDTETSNGNTYSRSTPLQLRPATSPATLVPLSRYPQPSVDTARLGVLTDEGNLDSAGTNQDRVIVSASEYAKETYMPTPLRVSSPSHLFPGDIAPAARDLQKNVSRRPVSDVDSDMVVTDLYVESKKTSTLVRRDSVWSISSTRSSISVPVVPTLSSSSSSLALSTISMKPRSHKSSTSSRQMSLAKCVPLDVLSRNMEIAENRAFQPGTKGVSADDRRDRHALLRVDNGIGSRSRSISAASSMTVYEDLEWVASRLDTRKEEKHDSFIFGRDQDHPSKTQTQGQAQKHDQSHLQVEYRGQTSPILKIGRVMRGRSLSIPLLGNLIGRQNQEKMVEEGHEPISPSSSMSFSSTSMLSSLSMSLSRSPASPISPFSVRSVGESEPASPSSLENDVSGKKGRYYWTQRRPEKEKKKSRSASDLQQGKAQDQVDLMVEGPADFMDLRDPFAPPDLGTRGSVVTLNRYGLGPEGRDAWNGGSSSRLATGSPSPVKMSEWGKLPFVVDSPTPCVSSLGQEKIREKEHRKESARTLAHSRGKVKARNAARSPPPSRVEDVTKRMGRGREYGQGKARRLKNGDRQCSSGECSCRSSVCGVDDCARQETQGRNNDVSPCPSPVLCPEGLDVEEALLAQRLLMRLDLVSPSSASSL